MTDCLLQKIGVLIQQCKEGGFGAKGDVNMSGCFAEQMRLACEFIILDESHSIKGETDD